MYATLEGGVLTVPYVKLTFPPFLGHVFILFFQLIVPLVEIFLEGPETSQEGNVQDEVYATTTPEFVVASMDISAPVVEIR